MLGAIHVVMHVHTLQAVPNGTRPSDKLSAFALGVAVTHLYSKECVLQQYTEHLLRCSATEEMHAALICCSLARGRVGMHPHVRVSLSSQQQAPGSPHFHRSGSSSPCMRCQAISLCTVACTVSASLLIRLPPFACARPRGASYCPTHSVRPDPHPSPSAARRRGERPRLGLQGLKPCEGSQPHGRSCCPPR